MPDGNNTVRAKPGSRLRELGLVPPKSPIFCPETGRVRVVYGVQTMPMGAPVMVDAVFEGLARFSHRVDRRANSCFSCGVVSSLLYDPGGKSALGLLRCSEWGQLSNSHGLDARTNEAPAPANPYVFRHLFSKLNRLALRNIRGISNDDFDFTT